MTQQFQWQCRWIKAGVSSGIASTTRLTHKVSHSTRRFSYVHKWIWRCGWVLVSVAVGAESSGKFWTGHWNPGNWGQGLFPGGGVFVTGPNPPISVFEPGSGAILLSYLGLLVLVLVLKKKALK